MGSPAQARQAMGEGRGHSLPGVGGAKGVEDLGRQVGVRGAQTFCSSCCCNCCFLPLVSGSKERVGRERERQR